MTEESNKILVGKLKQKLNITWNDEKNRSEAVRYRV